MTKHAIIYYKIFVTVYIDAVCVENAVILSSRLGIGPDGKPLPIANTKKVFSRMYPVLVVNQDGSSYRIRHTTPHQIITLPLDPATLTEEQRKVSTV